MESSPRLMKGGLVVIDPSSGSVRRVISLQYNPDSLSRALQVQGVGENGARSEALRLKGPAVETIKLEAELDAADQLEFPERNPTSAEFGIHPQIAALESLLNPSARDLLTQDSLAARGTLEIAPPEALLTVFVWSVSRVVPVRVTEFAVTEEAFDTNLNPIRARVSLSLRVLTVDDLPPGHRGNAIFMAYLQRKERLASLAPFPGLDALGLGGIP